MNKEKVLNQLEELGFALEEAGEYGYFFKFEGLNVLYMPDDDVISSVATTWQHRNISVYSARPLCMAMMCGYSMSIVCLARTT